MGAESSEDLVYVSLLAPCTPTARGGRWGAPQPTDAAVWGPFREAAARVLRPLQRHDGLPEGRLARRE
jgi:hypothetical protein